jgi:hypothetical protein
MAIGIQTEVATDGMEDTGPDHLMRGLAGSVRITMVSNFSQAIGKARTVASNMITDGIATTTATFTMTAMTAATIAAESRFQDLDPGRQLKESFF